ncbi:MAG TPA: adenylate/guanylate cyclase domain-containing response regulator [Gammaproteobacteria bacterium]|nr:adenylate/guanylate cyclase domain-containing response regulator [Gammaproteobacteria bacterium]
MAAHLLVVDDNEMNRDLLERRLVRAGYRVSVAEDGQQALGMLVDERFDLVLLDVLMPGMDGITVLGLIRRTYSMTELPVIMVTARDETGDIVDALERGANDYIAKPVNFPVALARIRTQLTARQASEEVRQLAVGLENRNRFIRKIFGRYVSDEVVERLLSEPEGLEFGGVQRRVSILMADLRGFTLLADALPPDTIVALLNNFLETMIGIIGRYQGTVAEIVGDGILAFFGAPVEDPRHALNAVACAIEMQNAMQAVNERGHDAGLPELQMGIGINSGDGVVGNIGSEIRSKYAVVGSVVNVASRIESCSSGGQVMISASTLQEVGAVVKIDAQRTIRPKGLRQPLEIFSISGIGDSYNCFLARHQEMPRRLAQAMTIRCTRVEDKQVTGQVFDATLTGLSSHSAHLCAAVELEAYSDLHLQLDDGDGLLYAKVLARLEGDGAFLVGFTSLTPDVRRLITRLLEGAGVPDDAGDTHASP